MLALSQLHKDFVHDLHCVYISVDCCVITNKPFQLHDYQLPLHVPVRKNYYNNLKNCTAP